MTPKVERLQPTTQPRDWGYSDDELAALPTVYRPDLLSGKVFIVTGGGSGIGKGITYLLSRLGADVMICGRRQEILDDTAAGIRKHLGREIAHAVR